MSELHALLIGIDAYLPNQIPGVGHYPLLQGCVRDVERVEEFLRKEPFLPLAGLEKLIAPLPLPVSLVPAEDAPTYKNLVAALTRITDAASPGDAVYIHYSGHGNQAATAYPEVKGEKGLDEVVVPVDIGNSETCYLRDIEIAHYLRLMAEKGLFVTLVLDSCHSGGASRGEEEVKSENAGKLPRRRGVSQPDKSKRPTDSLVATREELLASWQWHTTVPVEAVRMRDFQASTGWLPTPKGYVLIAACTPRQSAFEYAFEGEASSGALTHFLLAAMAELGPGATYRTLFNRLRARVETGFPAQTPMLVGECQRIVLGPDSASEVERNSRSFVPSGVVVLGVQEDGLVVLNTGAAQGVLDGARLAVYPPDADLANPGEPLALVEVVRYGATQSLAEVEGEPPASALAPGSRAMLFDPGAHRRTTVRFGPGLSLVADLMQETVFLRLAAVGEPADLQVNVNDRGQIEIAGPTGEPIPNLGPNLSASDSASASVAIDRLVHIARSWKLQQLENRSPQQDLKDQVVVELLGIEEHVDTTRKPAPRTTQGTSSLEMKEGQWTYLRVTNRSPQDLNIAVLDIQPDWGISQIHPGVGEGNLAPIEAGASFDLPLQAQLPAGINQGTDVLKVFATRGAAEFRWLEMPPLEQTRQRAMVNRLSNPDWNGTSSLGWTTAQVQVRIERSTARATSPGGPVLRDGSPVRRF